MRRSGCVCREEESEADIVVALGRVGCREGLGYGKYCSRYVMGILQGRLKLGLSSAADLGIEATRLGFCPANGNQRGGVHMPRPINV